MSFAEFVQDQLPAMRRYAFATLGSLDRADECLAHVIRGLLEETTHASCSRPPLSRADLFARLHGTMSAVMPERNSDRNLQVFLLLEMEGFSVDKVGHIIGAPLADLWCLVNSPEYVSRCSAWLKT